MALPSASDLKSLATPLSRPSLKRGVLDAVRSRGASEILDIMPYGVATGLTHGYNIKSQNPSGSAAANPRTRNRPSTGGRVDVRIDLEPKQFVRDAETAVIDIVALSDTNDQRDINVAGEAASLYEEWLTAAVHGMGGTDQVTGLDGHLAQLCGNYYGGSFAYAAGAKQISGARSQKVFATSTSAPGGTADSLEVGMIDDALSLIKGGRGSVRIMSNRASWVDFKRSLNLLGGNTTEHLIGGETVPGYDGTPWIVSDNVGSAKVSIGGGAITSSDATLTIGNIDSSSAQSTWVGFSDADVGRAITVVGAGAASADLVTTIASVTSPTVVELAVNASTTVSTANVTVAESNFIYVVKFDPMVGFAAFVPQGDAVQMGQYDEQLGDYYGRIAGFDLVDLGESSQAGRIVTDRLSWLGNLCLFSPFSAARYSHFALANT